jgi:hypothetical protein
MKKEKEVSKMDIDFMLKEYEYNNKSFEIHYKAVELTFNLFLVIITSFIGILSLVYKDEVNINIFHLDDLSLMIVFIASLSGLFLYLKMVEHRLLLITYVRSLNLIRKWFSDNSISNLHEYFIFPAQKNSPKYYRKFRHFYWEALSFSSITSTLFTILTLNILNRFITLKNNNFNYLFFAFLLFVFLFISILYYKKRGIQKEKNDI